MSATSPRPQRKASTARDQLQLVTIEEVARLLACEKSTVYRYARQGKLKAVGRVRAMRITMASVQAYIDREAREAR